jgi:hypothetical protein
MRGNVRAKPLSHAEQIDIQEYALLCSTLTRLASHVSSPFHNYHFQCLLQPPDPSSTSPCNGPS